MLAMELYLVGAYEQAIEKAKQASRDPGSIAHLAGFLSQLAQGDRNPVPTGGYATALEGLARGQKTREGGNYAECVATVNILVDLTQRNPDGAYIGASTMLDQPGDGSSPALENPGFFHFLRILALLQMNQLPLVKWEMGLLQAAESGSPLYAIVDSLLYGTLRSLNSLRNKFGITDRLRYLAEIHGHSL